MNKGFVVLHRKITEWEWYSDTNTLRVFLHLLLTANHKPSKFRGFEVDRGQVIIGRKALAKNLHLSEQAVRTSLEHLKSTGEITCKSTNKFTLITLTNYGLYQDRKPKSTNKITSQSTNNQPTINQQVTTSKQCNNVNNETNINTPSLFEKSDAGKTKTAAKKNGWAIWVDINRERNRVDPIPAGPDTKAAKFLTDNIDGIQAVKDVMRLFLDDGDPFLQRNGHALRHITGRVNAYLNLADQMFGGGDADDISDILAIEEQIAKREAEERERKQNGNIKGHTNHC